MSKNPSANIVKRMEKRRRTVNMGRLQEERGSAKCSPGARSHWKPCSFLMETPIPQKTSPISALASVGDPGDSPKPSPRGDPVPLAGVKHMETHTWLLLGWIEKEPHRPERLLLGSPSPLQSLRAGSSSPRTPGPPKHPSLYPPTEKSHPYLSFFVLNSPVIWFPKYRRGRGNV